MIRRGEHALFFFCAHNVVGARIEATSNPSSVLNGLKWYRFAVRRQAAQAGFPKPTRIFRAAGRGKKLG